MTKLNNNQDVVNENPSMTGKYAEPTSEQPAEELACPAAKQESLEGQSLETFAQAIKYGHDRVRRSTSKASNHQCRGTKWSNKTGQCLMWVKNHMPSHAHFLSWAMTNCSLDNSCSNHYLRIMRRYADRDDTTHSGMEFRKSVQGLLELAKEEPKSRRTYRAPVESNVRRCKSDYVMEFKVLAGKKRKPQEVAIQEISANQLKLLRQQIDDALAHDDPDASDTVEVANAV